MAIKRVCYPSTNGLVPMKSSLRIILTNLVGELCFLLKTTKKGNNFYGKEGRRSIPLETSDLLKAFKGALNVLGWLDPLSNKILASNRQVKPYKFNDKLGSYG